MPGGKTPLSTFPAGCKVPRHQAATTGNLVFAVCAKVCRVQIHGHTANINFAECAQENRRQNQSTRQSHILPCAFFWHTAKNTLPCAFFVTHGKAKLCRVFYFGTRQSNKKILSSHLETFSTLHIQHVVLHVKI